MAYVIFDAETCSLRVELPSELEHLSAALRKDLIEAFWGEPENLQTALRMDEFITHWVAEAQSR